MKRSVEAVVLAMLLVFSGNAVMAEEPTMELQEVVVTATKTEKDPKDVTQTVTVITADEIKKSGATSAAEVVRKTAGVTLNDQGPRGSLTTVSLRGSRYAQVLVLLDGKRLNSRRDGGYNLSDLPVLLDDIERIEIIRGPSSALYGADAVGGVVNIITKKPEKTQIIASGAVGSHGYDSATVSYSGKPAKFYYSLSTGRETSEGFQANSDLEQGSIGTKLGYDFTHDSSVELTANYIGKEIGVPGSTLFPSPQARQWTRDTVAGLGYRTKLSRELDLKINTYYNRGILKYKDPGAFFPQDSRHKSGGYGADTQVNWLVNPWNAITIGMETRRDTLDSTDVGDHGASLQAGYFQDEISIGEPLIIVIGGRHDSHSLYGDKFSPRASARYLFTGSGTIIRTSAGKAFRAPTFNDLYWPDTGWAVGNPNLRPETSKEYEGGIEQPLGKGNAIKLTAFERKVKNLIDWQLDPLTFKYSPVNIGRARIRGSEYEAKVSPAEFVTIALNYTYMNAVDEVTGEKIYYTIPKSQTKGSLILSLPTLTTIALEGRAVENYVKAGESEWKYSVFDGKVTQTVLTRGDMKGEVFAGIKNAFDRKYETVKDYPMPPREIYGGVSVQF
jgi:outer membrane cobalamin receptor